MVNNTKSGKMNVMQINNLRQIIFLLALVPTVLFHELCFKMIVWVLHRRGQQNYVTWGTRQQETNINQMFRISPQFVEERMPNSKI